MSTSLIEATLLELQAALNPLFNAVASQRNRATLLEKLSFRQDAVNGTDLVTAINGIEATYTAVRNGVLAPATSLAELKQQLDSFSTLITSLDSIGTLFAQTGVGTGLANLSKELLNFLFGTYLRFYHPKLYGALVVLSLVEGPAETAPILPVITTAGDIVRYSYHPYLVHFDRISQLLSNPKDYFKSVYYPYPQGIRTRLQSNEVADKLFPRLGAFLGTLGFEATYGFRDYGYLDYGSVSNELMQHMLTVELGQSRSGGLRFGFTLALSSADDGNLGLVISPFGALDYQENIGDWLVELLLTASIDGLAIGPQGVLLSGVGTSPSFGATASIVSQPDESGNTFQFGAAEGTHLAIGEVSFQAGLQVSNGEADYGLMAQANRAKFMLKPEGPGGFLKSIIPANGVSGTFDLGLGWSNSKGFYFLGNATTKGRYAINNKSTDRVLAINAVSVELAADSQGVTLNSTVSGKVTLGPVEVRLEEIGIAALLTFPNSHGNLGIANADVAFKTPTGVGIEVNSDTLTGGGYLFLDPAKHQYAGVAQLMLKTGAKEINLTALGLLQTELPGKPDAYSLVLLLTAQFSPIQLGLGFTLSGLGGLVGVNRAANTDYLRGLVRGGQLRQLLFPPNVLDNPAAALAVVEAAFPATEGHYVIGLMAKLGWGVPTNIITLDVALLIELSASLRVVLLGVLESSLPSPDKALLKLRADFLGVVDFGAKKVSFDATLSDSRLLAFALTGDVAFRLYQGTNPLFILSAGGFHPAFQRPAGSDLTGLSRLTLSLANDSDRRITLTSYFAVTSNTVQFGAHLALYVRICRGLHVDGYFGFDVLFQFSPFRVLAHVEAGVAIKYGRRELLSLHLSLDVSGPGPWHVWGRASFRIWFIRIHVDVDITVGDESSEPTLPGTDVRALLVSALNATASWEVTAPPAALPGGVVLRPVTNQTAQFFLEPRGALSLRQRVAPLGLQLEKYGSGAATPLNGQRFDLTELVVGADHYPATNSAVEVVRDFFAPDQFRKLSDAQKISAPSFQLLPCGLRLKSLDGLTAGPNPKATRRVVEYEQKRVGSPSGSGLAEGTSGGSVAPRLKMSSTVFQQLARGGALGQAVQATQPSARAPQPVGWTEDTYAVVHADTLALYDAQHHARFGSQVEAEQFRQGLIAKKPTLAGEVLVVPSYQLELA